MIDFLALTLAGLAVPVAAVIWLHGRWPAPIRFPPIHTINPVELRDDIRGETT